MTPPPFTAPEALKAVQKVQGAVERNLDLITESENYICGRLPPFGDEYPRLVKANHNVVRNPRGAITPHKLKDGKHIALLFYNNGQTEKVHPVQKRHHCVASITAYDTEDKVLFGAEREERDSCFAHYSH